MGFWVPLQHGTFAKFDLSVVYVPARDSTVADCLSRWAYPAGKAWMDIFSHGDSEETEEAKRIIQMEKAMEQEGFKCFVVTAKRTDLAKFRGARVQAIGEEPLEQWMVAPVELGRSVLTEDWSDDYAGSDHWSRYWNAVSAPSDDEWPEGLTEDGDKLFLKDKLLVPENRMEELIDHGHNAQLMHPGRDKMQQDLEWRFKFPPGYYAILDRYCNDSAVCRAMKSPNHSTAGNPVYRLYRRLLCGPWPWMYSPCLRSPWKEKPTTVSSWRWIGTAGISWRSLVRSARRRTRRTSTE